MYNFEKFRVLKNNHIHSYLNLIISFIIVIINKRVLKNFIFLYAKVRKREWIINEIRNA